MIKKREFDVLFVDFMVEDTHKVYCNELITRINKKCSTLSIVKNNYLDFIEDEDHSIIYYNAMETVQLYPVKARVNTCYNFYETMRKIRNMTFNTIIVLGYDPVMFSFMYKHLLQIGQVIVVEHHQLDEVSRSKIKTKLWNLYKNKINHILLDESIVDTVSRKFNIDIKKIYVLPHPCKKQKSDRSSCLGKQVVLAISGSNDLEQLKQLIEYEKETHFLEKNNILIYIRGFSEDISEVNSFRSIDGYLTEEEYDTLYTNCSYVLMPFPERYRYRCSGTLIDALSAGKCVISSKLYESNTYAKIYPNICATYDSIVEIGDIIKKMSMANKDDEFVAFALNQKNISERGAASIINRIMRD